MSGFRQLKNVIAFSLFAGFYFLLAQSFDAPEIIVGAVSSLLAAIALNAVAARSPVRYAIPRDWPMLSAASPFRVLKACAVVLAAIPRAAKAPGRLGEFRELRMGPYGDRPDAATRAGLATWAVSLAPDNYAIDFDSGALVVHHLPAKRTRPAGGGDA